MSNDFYNYHQGSDHRDGQRQAEQAEIDRKQAQITQINQLKQSVENLNAQYQQLLQNEQTNITKIQTLNDQVQQLIIQVDNLNKSVSERDQKIIDLNSQIQELKAVGEHLYEEVSKRDEKIQQLENKYSTLKDVVKVLINPYDESLLKYSSEGDTDKMVAAILLGGNIEYTNTDGQNALFLSLMNNQDCVSKTLINLNANLDVVDKNKQSILDILSSKNKLDLFSYILDQRSIITSKFLLEAYDKFKDQAIKHKIANKMLFVGAETCDDYLIDEAFKRNCNVNVADKKMETALHKACRSGNINAVRKLLENHCNIHCVNSYYQRPRELTNNIEIIKLLDEYDHIPNVPGSKKTKDVCGKGTINTANPESSLEVSLDIAKAHANGVIISPDNGHTFFAKHNNAKSNWIINMPESRNTISFQKSK